MKDEYKGNLIKEFAGLRPKMYSILETDGHKNSKKHSQKNIEKNSPSILFRSSIQRKKFVRDIQPDQIHNA